MPPRPIETRRKISRPGRKSKADVAHIAAATRLSLRKSPLYKPYRNAIHSIAGFADIPRGALESATVISRGAIVDAIESEDIALNCGLPRMKACCRCPPVSQDDRVRWAVVGAVMQDLGYSRYSERAWSRQPCGVA
jgi:hypothetical protein